MIWTTGCFASGSWPTGYLEFVLEILYYYFAFALEDVLDRAKQTQHNEGSSRPKKLMPNDTHQRPMPNLEKRSMTS